MPSSSSSSQDGWSSSIFFILQNHMLQMQNFITLKARLSFSEAMSKIITWFVSRRLDAQCINDSLIDSEGRAAQTSRIHFKISFHGGAFALLASVLFIFDFSCSQPISYFSVQLALKVLFHETSGAWTYFVHQRTAQAENLTQDIWRTYLASFR